MLIFKKIEIENYISFGPKQTFNLGPNPGLYLIKGINLDNVNLSEDDVDITKYSVGSGKSSFMSSIEFCLWGDISARFKTKDSVVNKRTVGGCCVALDFDKIENKNITSYRIERYRQHSKYKNNVMLFIWSNKEEKWINQTKTKITETQNDINKIIMYTQELFHRSISLNRDNIQQFLSYNTTQRINVIEALTNAIDFKKIFENVKKKVKDLQKNLDNTENELNIYNQQIQNNLQNIINIQEQKKIRINKIDNEIIQLEKTINKPNIPIELDIKDLTNNIKTFADYDIYLQQLKELKTSYNNIESKIINITKQKQQVSQQIKDTKNKNDNIKPSLCPECNAILDGKDFNDKKTFYKDLLKKYVEDFKSYKEQLSILHDELQNAQQILDALIEPTIDKDFYNNYKKYQYEIDSWLEDCDNINSKIELLNNNKTELIENQDAEKILKKSIKEQKKLLPQLKEQINDLKNKIKLYDFWKDAFDINNEYSLKQHMINTIIPIFNKFVSDNLDFIYDGNLQLIFDNNLNEQIIYFGEDYEYSEFSTGEQIKLNLGINLALFDMIRFNLIDTNVVFLDEIFTNVDEPTTCMFLKLIEERYAKNACVHLVSHQPYVEDNIERQSLIEIIKENNFSSIRVS